MRFPLRAKFFLFATLIAIAPLALVGQNLVRIARDELKSAANEDLTAVAAGLAADFDATVAGPLADAAAGDPQRRGQRRAGVEQKISLSPSAWPQIPTSSHSSSPSRAPTCRSWSPTRTSPAHLPEAGLDPVETLRTPVEAIAAIRHEGRYGQLLPRRLEATGDWLATVALPLRTEIAGRTVTLSAQIDLAPLGTLTRDNPFTRRGEIAVVDADGRTVLEPEPRALADRAIVANAVPLIVGNARPEAIEGYVRPDGQAMLGAYAFPDAFPGRSSPSSARRTPTPSSTTCCATCCSSASPASASPPRRRCSSPGA